jgi:uncharacterized protein
MAMINSAAYARDYVRIEEQCDENEERLSRVDPSQRVLLISHCLRNSAGCRAVIQTWGIDCVECNPRCQVNLLRRRALNLGYKGVCVAPGGSLALKYVRENAPRGIIAVACRKELEEGIESVCKLAGTDAQIPPIVVIPLTKDGCVDTEVNVDQALGKISLGCASLS